MKKVCREIISQYSQVVAFVRFGTKKGPESGSDFDLYCICRQLPGPQIQKVIRDKLQAACGQQPLDLYFSTKKDLESGIFCYDKSSCPILNANDPHDPFEAFRLFADNSLLCLYLFSTMEVFVKKPSVPLNPHQGLKAVRLTSLGAIEWTHHYIMWFLNRYLKESRSEAYAIRLAKFLPRVALGCTIAALGSEDLKKAKLNLEKSFLKSSGAYEIEMINFIKTENPAWLYKEASDLLDICAFMRSEDEEIINSIVKNEERRIWFCRKTADLIFYLSYQQGSNIRRLAAGPFDPLAAMVIESLVDTVGKKENRLFFADGETLIKKNEIDKAIYFIPRFRITGEGSRVPNGEVVVKVPSGEVVRSAGRIIGEIAALTGGKILRTADVKVRGQLETYKIPGQKIIDLLSSRQLKKILKNLSERKVLKSSQKARFLDLMLIYFAYESASYLRDLTSYSLRSKNSIEENLQLKKNNPFYLYCIRDYARLAWEMFAQNGRLEAIRRLTFSDGELVFSKGDATGDKFYIVEKGQAVIAGIAKDPKVSVTLLPNSVFGEASLIRMPTRSGSCQARGKTQLLEVEVAVFEQLTSSRKYIGQSQTTQRELLYHFAFLNFGRVLGNLTV